MSQVTIRRPFGELDLWARSGFESHAVFHFFLGQGPFRPAERYQQQRISHRKGVSLALALTMGGTLLVLPTSGSGLGGTGAVNYSHKTFQRTNDRSRRSSTSTKKAIRRSFIVFSTRLH